MCDNSAKKQYLQLKIIQAIVWGGCGAEIKYIARVVEYVWIRIMKKPDKNVIHF